MSSETVAFITMVSTIVVALATVVGASFAALQWYSEKLRLKRRWELLQRAWANLQVSNVDTTRDVQDSSYRGDDVWAYKYSRFVDSLVALEESAHPSSRYSRLCDRARAKMHYREPDRRQILETIDRLTDVVTDGLDS